MSDVKRGQLEKIMKMSFFLLFCEVGTTLHALLKREADCSFRYKVMKLWKQVFCKPYFLKRSIFLQKFYYPYITGYRDYVTVIWADKNIHWSYCCGYDGSMVTTHPGPHMPIIHPCNILKWVPVHEDEKKCFTLDDQITIKSSSDGFRKLPQGSIVFLEYIRAKKRHFYVFPFVSVFFFFCTSWKLTCQN